jgi:hypothetical protein
MIFHNWTRSWDQNHGQLCGIYIMRKYIRLVSPSVFILCNFVPFRVNNTNGDYLPFWEGKKVKVKVKQSHYRPGQGLRISGGWGSKISRHSAHEGGKVVSPTHRPPFTPRKHSWYSFLLEAVNPKATVRPEVLCQWEIPMTPSGIEPATFGLVV